MVEIENVTRWFGAKLAVDNVSFAVGHGEVLGFIGPNGAGKSTTMRILTGFLPSSSGHVRVNQYDMATQPLEAKRALGYLPENAPLYAGMTVRSFLDYIAELRGIRTAERPIRIAKASADCHIEHVMDQGVETLSKGYRHRVCLAQALIHDPKVLVLDEPTDGLDPNQKQEIRQLIRRLGREGKTVILSTHILEEVEEVCGRVVVISRGKNVFDGTVSAFRRISGIGVRLEVEAFGGDENHFRALLDRLIPAFTAEIKAAANGRVRASVLLPESGAIQPTRILLEKGLQESGWTNANLTEAEIRLDEAFIHLTHADRQMGDEDV